MFNLLRQRNFSLLWFGGLISFTGDWITLVALPVYVYSLTNSVAATGIVWMVNMIPSVVLGSIAGVYVDRWDRRVTMIAANVVTVPLMLALLLVHSPDQVWIIYVAGLLKSTVGNFMAPAENALLPKLVGEEHLQEANALNTLNNNIARLIGPALGGAVLFYLGFQVAVLLDTTSFLVAAIMIALVNAPKSVTRVIHDDSSAEQVAANVWRELADGLMVVRNSRLISSLFIFMGVAMLAEGLFEVLLAPYVHDVLQGGANEYGWLLTAEAVGGLVGGVLMGPLSKRVKAANLIGPGLVGMGIIIIAVFNLPFLVVDLFLFVLVGPPVIALQTGIQTLLQTTVEDRFMGRVFGAFGTAISLSILVGQGVASVAGSTVGIVPLLTFGGLITTAVGLFATVMMARFDREHLAAKAESGVAEG